MNITFVSDAIYPYNKGGKEKRLNELSVRLAKLGHDVHIYTMHWWEDAEKSRVENGVTLHAISKLYPMYSGNRRSIKQGIFFGLACFKLMRVNFGVLDVDHMPFFPIYSAWIVCALKRKKLFGTWHEALSRQDWTEYMGKAGNIAFIIERLSIKLPYSITSTCQQTKDAIKNIHKRSKRVALITPGINTQLINGLKPSPVGCDVLYIGRLVKDKNVDKLVHAIHLMKSTKDNVQCIIVGHGVEKPTLEKLISKLQLENNIQLLDPLTEDREVYGYMKAAKVFCLPSVREGFGMVVLESLGCGTPVITTNSTSNSSRFHIKEGRNGSIVDLNPQSIAAAIKLWTNSPKPRHIADDYAEYDWNTLTAKQIEAYAV